MKQLVCNKSSSGRCSVSHPAGCVQLQSGTDVCVAVTLNHWSQRASCSTDAHILTAGLVGFPMQRQPSV